MKLSSVYRGKRVYIIAKGESRREAIVQSSINNFYAEDHKYYIRRSSTARGVGLAVKYDGFTRDADGNRVKVTYWVPEVRGATVLHDADTIDRNDAVAKANEEARRQLRAQEQADHLANVNARLDKLPVEGILTDYQIERLRAGRTNDIYVSLETLEKLFAKVREQVGRELVENLIAA